jgi:predicted dehydrogenase
MVNAVINDVELEPMVATFEDGYKAVVICDAILKSSKSGKKEKVVY